MTAKKTRAEELREKLARASAAAKEQQERKTAPKPTPAESTLAVDREHLGLHTKPIRSTVDLPPVQHHGLKDWCSETAVMIGKTRVTTQDVVRAMVARLLTDETFARSIRADLTK
ncbi:hypothetical protein ACFWNN_45295 [Lentzea sp. NPDC058450]|uniref:hypothetical protein n=1 Tax=Lentzea sp. NPDC058450 TaxID=3346505 RepID=UPI0036565527